MAERLEDIAARMVAPGKGILAADESTGTINKRFEAIGIASTEDSRRDYREMFFRADEAMRNYVSGVILYDETIRQKAKDGTPLVERHRRRPAPSPASRSTRAPSRCACARREDHRGPRRPPRAAEGVLRARRPLRQMARGDRHRAGHAEPQLHPRQRPRARPLRRALPGGRHRADRRAGSADGRPGRHPRHRHLLRGHRVDAEGGLRANCSSPASSSKAWC